MTNEQNGLASEGSAQQAAAIERYRATNLTLRGLWIYYFGLGGDADEFALDGYLHGVLSLAPGQRGLVDSAIDELTTEGPAPRTAGI